MAYYELNDALIHVSVIKARFAIVPPVVRRVIRQCWQRGLYPFIAKHTGVLYMLSIQHQQKFIVLAVPFFDYRYNLLIDGDPAIFSGLGFDAANHIPLIKVDIFRPDLSQLSWAHTSVAEHERDLDRYLRFMVPQFFDFVVCEWVMQCTALEFRHFHGFRIV